MKETEPYTNKKSRDRRHDKEESPGKHQHRGETHLTDGDARLEEASILVRWDGGWRWSQREPPPQRHLSWSPLLAIMINGAERASRSAVRKRDLCPNSLIDQKSRVSGSTPRYLYHRGKLNQWFRTHAWDSAWCARHLGLFTIQAVQRPTTSIYPVWRGNKEGELSRHDFEKVWSLFLDGGTPTAWCNSIYGT
jgi:hypothetical protein